MCLVIFLPFHIWFDIKTSPKIKYLQILYYGNANLLPFSLKTAIYILNKKFMLLWRCFVVLLGVLVLFWVFFGVGCVSSFESFNQPSQPSYISATELLVLIINYL